MEYIDIVQIKKRICSRLLLNKLAKVCFIFATLFGLIVLAILLVRVISEVIAWINVDFLTSKLSTQADRAGIMGAILGTFWLMVVVGPVSMFFGVGTAIYLELYLKKGKLQSIIQTNITNLAGVPSIVYGILGLTVFVRALDFGNIVLAGGLTMSLLVLPIIVTLIQEAIRAVPQHLIEALYCLGEIKMQKDRRILLTSAFLRKFTCKI